MKAVGLGDSGLKARLAEALSAAGLFFRVASPALLVELEGMLAELVAEGAVSRELLDTYGPSFQFVPPEEVKEVRSLLVVAASSPAVKVRFRFEEGPFEAVIPPTYISTPIRQETLRLLRSVLEPAGYNVARVAAPVKLLAVRTGLARYGRNNVAYVPNLGSLVRLDAYSTDAPLPPEEEVFQGSWRLSSCPPCRNCHHVCPTGCIPYDGTVIQATRCLTYLNEQEGEWPDWLDPTAHNALVGCMRCQELCPADRFFLRIPKVVAEFDGEETQWILQDRPAAELPPNLRAKLQALDLEDYTPVLGRNLRALWNAERIRLALRSGD